jgi:hypothetical protein
MRAKHVAIFERFSGKFSPSVVKKWTEMVEKWEADQKKPNPYSESVIGEPGAVFHVQELIGCRYLQGSTMAKVRAELQKDELDDAKRGDVQMHATSPHSFLHVGLELEEQQ